eukprot:TRINITY_DN662_c0_g1_i1.p1 TRINITY_DN662_c0_g1~~TRINITY_DN662_c0_g1_i1.p1  ORF type:complete len:106 (+),score=25.03 TRINITY_DN662_c0_g1_i1:51-368(+)
MPVITLEKESDFADLLKSGPLLVDFTAKWCGPCQRIKPALAEISDKLGSNCKVVAIDVDDFSDLMQQHGVTAMPTFVFFENGAEVNRACGASKESIEELVAKYLK